MYNKIIQIQNPIYHIVKYQIQTNKDFLFSNNPQNQMNLNMMNQQVIVMNGINPNMGIGNMNRQMNQNMIHQVGMNMKIPQNMINAQVINQTGANDQMGQKIIINQNMGINNKIDLNIINKNIGMGGINGQIPQNIMKNQIINQIGAKGQISQNFAMNQNMGMGYINGQKGQKMMNKNMEIGGMDGQMNQNMIMDGQMNQNMMYNNIMMNQMGLKIGMNKNMTNMNNMNNNQIIKKNMIGNAMMNPMIEDQKMKINNRSNLNNRMEIILNNNNPQNERNKLQSLKDYECASKEEENQSDLEFDIMSTKFPKPLNKIGNNVIYYDPNFSKRPSEIFKGAEMFKVNTNGAFILVMNKESLRLVLEEIQKLNTNCKFDLICTGSSSKEILEFIQKNEFFFIFKRYCLFTYHPEKYTNLYKIYPLIKGVYYNHNEVLKFLKEASQSTPILRTLQLMTLKDYTEYGKHLHKLIAKHYNNFSKSNYLEAIEKVRKFMDNPDEYRFRILNENGERKNQLKTMLKALKLYENVENNYEKIIKKLYK